MTQTNILTTADLERNLDELEKDRKQWERNELRASNMKLYELLGRCYLTTCQVRNSKQFKSYLRERLKLRKINFKAGSSIETYVIALVFGDCGHNLATYSSVLRIASKELPKEKSLPQWISDLGGIENVRRTKGGKKAENSRKSKIEVATQFLEVAPASWSVKGKRLNQLRNDNALHSFSAGLIHCDEQGGYWVSFVSMRETVINALLLDAHKELELEQSKVDEIRVANKANLVEFSDVLEKTMEMDQ